MSSNGVGMDRYLSRWGVNAQEDIDEDKRFVEMCREPKPPPAEIYRWQEHPTDPT